MVRLQFCSLVLLAGLLGTSTLATRAEAGIVRVPEDLPTIQLGIAHAAPGDTVLVAPGLYPERIDFMGKGIVVGSHFVATGDPSLIPETIIDPSGAGTIGSAVTFDDGETSSSVLQGFTIRNASASVGAGVLCIAASPRILDNIICHNRASSSGGGIYDSVGASTISRNKIFGNQAVRMDGGGIWALYASTTISGNEIYDNFSSFRGAGIYCEHSTPTISDNIVHDNVNASYYAGGIASRNCMSIITGNTVFNNEGGAFGGGIFY